MNTKSEHVVLITGSTQGLGAVIARDCAMRGVHVIVHGRDRRDAGDVLVESLRAEGLRAEYVPFDVCDADAVNDAVAQIESDIAPIGGLIDCSSQFDTEEITALAPARFDAVLRTTLIGSLHVCQAVLPRMQLRRSGRVILFGCVGCERNYHGTSQVAYRIAASGNLTLTKAFAQSYARDGITVNLIAPGHLENTEAPVDVDQLPLGRLSRLDEVLPTVRFLLSEESAHVNGAQINVSGGYVR